MLNEKHLKSFKFSKKKKNVLFSLKAKSNLNLIQSLNSFVFIKKPKFCFFTNKNKTVFKLLNFSRHQFSFNLNFNKINSFSKNICKRF
jgi:hypothetical protein